MNKLLLKTSVLALLSFAIVNIANSQVIVETFESAYWTTGPFTTGAQAGTTITAATATATTIAITTNAGSTASNSVAVSIAGVRTLSTLTWAFSKASIQTITTTANSASYSMLHSAKSMLQITSGGGYLIAPVLSNGVAAVSFWTSKNGGAYGGSAYLNTTAVTTAATYNTAVGFTANMSAFGSGGAGRNYNSYAPQFTGAAGLMLVTGTNGTWLDDIVIISYPTNEYMNLATLGSAVTENFDIMGPSYGGTELRQVPTGFRFCSGNAAVYSSSPEIFVNQCAGLTGTNAVTTSSTGATYSFADAATINSTDRCLGFLSSSGTGANKSIMLKLRNNTGSTINLLDISYNYEKYRLNTTALNFKFYVSTNGSTWTENASGSNSYAADGSASIPGTPSSISKSFTQSGLTITNGSDYYIMWSYEGAGATNSQAVGIDNLSITPRSGAPTIDGTISSNEYGTHTNGNNQQSSATGTWYMTWDANNLYIGISGTNTAEGAVVYLDKAPVSPVTGGTNSDGNLVGYNNYDGSNFAALQFRADLVVYFKDGYREYRTADGSGGWSAQTAGFGNYASASGTKEVSIPWSAIGGMPSSFNWFGYVAYTGGGAYASVPTENPGSGAGTIIGSSAYWERYYTVSTTTIGSSTPPFSRNSFIFNNTSDENSFGAVSVYDFTMNTSGRQISRSSTGGNWTIAGNLVVNNGTIYSGSSGGPFGTTAITGNLTVSGGKLDIDYNTNAFAVNGNVTISGGELDLGQSSGGDINLKGNWNKSGGTFTTRGRMIEFNGTSAQTLTGATTFDYLKINNSTGVTLQTTSPVTVNTDLTLTAGKLTLGANDLTYGGTNTITAGSTNYVVTNSTGQFKRVVAGSARNFPVGNAAYNPITLTNSGTSDTYGILVNDGAITATSPFAITKTINRLWKITEASAGGSTLTIAPTYNTTTEENNAATFNGATTPKVGLYNGSSWSEVTATASGSPAVTFTANSTFSPSDLTTAQSIALAKDDGLINPPSTITIAANSPSAGTITAGSTSNKIHGLQLTVTTNNTTLTGVTVNTTGSDTYAATAATDLTNFKLWINTTNNLSGSPVQLGTTITNAPTHGGSLAFTTGGGLPYSVTTATGTYYLLLTADVASSATPGNTITIASTAFTNITFANATKSGTDPVAAAGTQTIIKAPTVTTGSATNITTTDADLAGTVNANASPTTGNIQFQYGTTVGYGTSVTSSPSSASGTGNTSVTATSFSTGSLTANTLYHYRLTATNAAGTTNGSDATFVTLPNPPTISSGNNSSAVASVGAGTFTAYWTAPAVPGTESYTYSVEVNDDNTFTNTNEFTQSGIVSGTTTASVVGLSSGITYYYRVKTVNATGSSTWSSPISDPITTTSSTVPVLDITAAISVYTTSTADGGGTVLSNGGAAITDRGLVYNTTSPAETGGTTVSEGGTGISAFTKQITSLSQNTLYYVKSYATNSVGTGYGTSEVSFTTLKTEPNTNGTLSYSPVADVSMTVDFAGGNGDKRIVIALAGSAPTFTPADLTNYTGANSVYSSAPALGTGKLVYNGSGTSVNLTGLTKNTTYYFLVYEYSENSASVANYYATGLTGSQATKNPAITKNETGFISNAGNIVTGSSSSPSTFTVSGTELVSDITVTAPSGFEVSPNGSTWGTFTITPTAGTVTAVTVYVRFSPSSANGANSGNVTLAATSVTTVNVAVSGNAIAAEPTDKGTITFGTVTTTSIIVNYALPGSGNGTNRIVVIRAGSAVSFAPTDGAGISGTVSAAFGTATDQGSGNKVVYNGTGSGSGIVTITGLTTGITYHFAVYEYNVVSGTSQNYYATSATANQATTYTPASSDHFRSNTTGSWSTASVWDASPDGTNWFTQSSLVPTSSATSIRIQSGHTINVGAAQTSSNITVEAGATLSINTGGTVTMGSSKVATINGTVIINAGTLVLSSATMNVDGTSAAMTQSAAGTFTGVTSSTLFFKNGAYYNHQINSGAIPGANWISAGASTLNVTGVTTTSPSNMNNLTYYNVIWNCTGQSSSLAFSSQVNGNFRLESSGSTFLQFTSGTPSQLTFGSYTQTGGVAFIFAATNAGGRGVTCNGDFDQQGGSFYITKASQGTATNANGPFNLTIKGNLTQASGASIINEIATTATEVAYLIFNGTSAQTADFDGTLTGLNVSINNSNGVTLSSNLAVDKKLTFTAGKITTGSNSVILGTTGSVIGAGTGWVIGNLAKQTANSASPTFTYAIGDATNYTPIALAFTGNNTSGSTGTITASVLATEHPQISTSGIDNTKSVNRYWTLTNSGISGFTSYAPTFTYISGDNDGSGYANYVVRLYNGSNWSTTTISPTPNATNATATGLTTFGSLAIGEKTSLTVTTQPSGTTVCDGAVNVTFTSASTSTPSPDIQWERNNGGGYVTINGTTDGSIYSGYTTGTLTISTATTALTGYLYRAVFTNVNGSVNSNGVALTVNATSTSNAGSDQNICDGSGATLAASGTGTGTWSVISGPDTDAGQFSNVNSATATFTPAGGVGAYTLQWSVTNSPCSAATDNVVINVKTTGQWVGPNTGGDWLTGSNWCGGVPAPGSSVTIPSGVTVNVSSGDVSIKDITINAGGSLVMTGGHNINISNGGTITNSGTFDATASTGAVIFAGAGSIGGTITFGNVELNGSVAFSSATTIGTKLQINSGGVVTSNSPAYSTSGSGATLVYNASANGSGNKYVQALEWPSSNGPVNVILQNGNWVEMSSDRSLSGNLTVTSGALQSTGQHTLTMNGTAQTITVSNTSGGAIYGTDNGFGNDLILTVAGGSTTTWTGDVTGGSDDEKKLLNINVDAGGTLALSRGILCKYGTFTVNGTLQINANGYVQQAPSGDAKAPAYSGTGSLVYNSGGSYNMSYEWSGTGSTVGLGVPYSVSVQNTGTSLTIGSARSITGTLTVNSGTEVILGAAYTGASSVAGTLQLNSGGTVSAAPAYTGTSGLKYNQGGSLSTGNEWTANGSTAASGVPQNVTIQNSTTLNMPSSDRGLAGDLNINSGSLILNATSGDFFVGGNWTRSSGGTFTHNSRNVTFNSANKTVITAPVSSSRNSLGGFGGEVFHKLYMNKSNASDSVRLASNISIGNELGFVKGAFDCSIGDVTIASNKDITAHVAAISNISDVTVNYSDTGKFIIHRHLAIQSFKSSRRWRLLTAPISSSSTNDITISRAWQEGAANSSVSTAPVNPQPGYGTTITNGNTQAAVDAGFDMGINTSPSIYYLNPGLSPQWVAPSSTNAFNISSKEGYMIFVRGDRSIQVGNQYVIPDTTTLEPKGRINIGNVTKSLIEGKQIIANPYASSINFNNVSFNGVNPGTEAGAGLGYSLWDPRTPGAYDVGQWVVFSSNGDSTYNADPAENVSGLPTDGTIESGAAFLIISGGPGSLVIHESDKLPTSSAVGMASRPSGNRPVSGTIAKISSNMYLKNSDGTTSLMDGVSALYNPSYHDAVDIQDALKVSTFTSRERISIVRDGKMLSTERRQTMDTIFLSVNKMNTDVHQLKFISSNFDPTTVAYLEDKFLNTQTLLDLTDTTYYDFVLTADLASADTSRFRIIFKPTGSVPVTINSVKASQTGSAVAVEWTVENELNIRQYEVEKSTDGRKYSTLGTTQATGLSGYSWLDATANHGDVYYRIKLVNSDGSVQYSRIVKVTVGTAIASMSVYPNPIVDNKIGLQLTNMPKGKYSMRVLNSVGQVLLNKTIQHNGGSASESLYLPKYCTSGVYKLEVVDENNSKTTINLKK